MNKKISKKIENVPDMIVPSKFMFKPNQTIQIYYGIYELIKDDKTIRIEGPLTLEWLPTKRVRFAGRVLESSFKSEELLKLSSIYELKIDGLVVGNCRPTGINLGDNTMIEGDMTQRTVIGDKSVPVSKICFSIPNLRDFYGDPVKLTKGKSITLFRNRIVFENEVYAITIDKSPNYNDQYRKLKAKGGYIFLYYGEVVKKNGSIQYSELDHLIYSFSSFLSFLNGRRCSMFNLQGLFDDKIIWTDYTPFPADLFRHVYSWPPHFSIDGLNDLWKTFYSIWKDKNEEDFLKAAIHWYIEANYSSIYVEGSIILAQIGLELIYNWLLIENKKMLIGKDADNISAANKIRLLLSQLVLKSELPNSLKTLQKFVIDNELPDGIEAFVQIRNALVHSAEEKRKKLQNIDQLVLYDARNLGLWYLELSLLNILGYNGKYQFRCSDKTWTGDNEVYVPWLNLESHT